MQIETQVNNFEWISLYFFSSISDEDKLVWAFRLYDVDNNGVIDVDEMANIIETLDCIEGVRPGVIRYDENGNPVPIAETRVRAEELFDVSCETKACKILQI